MTRIATLLALFTLTLPAVAQDSDGDGVPSTLEETGYRWNAGPDVFEACTPGVDNPCFVTDPASWSSDGDPYSDGQEASGVNMDSAVPRPYNSPLVAAYPVIEVALGSYSFTSTSTITDSNGTTLSESETIAYGAEATVSTSVTAGVESSFPGGVTGSVEATASFSATVSYSGEQTSGKELNWETATQTSLGDAGILFLSVAVRNSGGAAARNIRPTFNVFIGDDLIQTIFPDDVIETLDPGAVSPPVVPTVNGESLGITLTFDRLRALQTGAPVRIEVVEIIADIRRWSFETSQWGCGAQGQETCPWSDFQSQILPRTLRLLVDFGYTNDPEAVIPFGVLGSPYEFRVYTGSPSASPENTLRDVLLFLDYNGVGTEGDALDIDAAGDALVIEGRAYPDAWLLTEQYGGDGPFGPIEAAWNAAGQPDNLLNVVMPTQATLQMASPDPENAGPIIAATSLSEDLLGVRAVAIAKGNLPVVSAEAHVTQYGGTQVVVPMTLSDDGTVWTTEGSDADPFLVPAGAASSYVVFTDLSGASRRTTEPLGLPIRPAPTCEEADFRDFRDNPAASGFDVILFPDSDLDTPVETYCGSEATAEYFWVPKATDLGVNGLYGAVFIDERTVIATGTESIIRSTDGGRTWTTVEVDGLNAVLWDIARRPNTGTLIAVGGNGKTGTTLRSTDDGLTWTFSDTGTSRTMLSVDHGGGDTWYATGEDRIMTSTDDGLTWVSVPTNPGPVFNRISVAFRDAQTGIVLDEGNGSGGTGRTWRTTDGGQTWENVFVATTVTDVTYAGDDTWYIAQNLGTPRRVLRSRQNGNADSWEILDLPSNATSPRSVDFLTPNFGYVAGNGGVFRTEDGGETWTGESANGVSFRAVAAFDANRSLVVGTSGRAALTTSGGGFPAPVPVANEDSEPSTAPVTFSLDSAYPNPFRDQATLAYSLGQAGDVSLTVFDVLGRRVATLVDAPQAAGAHTVRFDGRGLAAGVYVVRLLVGDRAETRRMTLVP
ncbi:MAG: binary toxin-like calcium binding domain-containing protein [Bacteroidota bacterium]